MNIYIPNIPNYAGYWIFQGYKNAWCELGYNTIYYSKPEDININDDYYIMINDTWIGSYSAYLLAIEKSEKAFVQAQPNTFPLPWGKHPNFHSLATDDTISILNEMGHVFLWACGDDNVYHDKWKTVYTVPLAFDSVSYKPIKNDSIDYDICYVGSWANNGFNEKRKIILEVFSKFMNSGLKCCFFVNKNLTHEQELAILYNSKTCLNIHDAYQRILGYDTNERTFKTLGLNGTLISDEVDQLTRLFPEVQASNNSNKLVEACNALLDLSTKDLRILKETNIEHILANHCYTHRVKKLLQL